MQLVVATLVRTGSAAAVPLTAAAIGDLCWAHARPVDAVEHIRVRSGPDRIDIVLFTTAADAPAARAAARRVVDRMLTEVPALSGWRLQGTTT